MPLCCLSVKVFELFIDHLSNTVEKVFFGRSVIIVCNSKFLVSYLANRIGMDSIRAKFSLVGGVAR